MNRPRNEFPSPAETTRGLGETPPTTPHCEQRSIESSTSGGSSEDSSGGRGRVDIPNTDRRRTDGSSRLAVPQGGSSQAEPAKGVEVPSRGGSGDGSPEPFEIGGRGRVYRQATEFAADPQAVLLSTSCWCGAEKSEGPAFCVKCLGLLPPGIRFGLASLDPGEGLEEAFELAIGHLDRFGGESGCEVF